MSVSGAAGETASADLSGTGIEPANLSVAPPHTDFGFAADGVTTAPQTLTASNLGEETSGVVMVILGGDDATQFAIDVDGCAGIALAGGATCDVSVVFHPTGGAGARNATLDVSAIPGGTPSAPTLFGIDFEEESPPPEVSLDRSGATATP